MTKKLRVGVIGAGVFGTYHARKAAASEFAELVGVYDAGAEQAARLAEKESAAVFETETDLISSCDALIVATPARTHFDLGQTVLRAGKHVLVEKPLALSGTEAEALVDLAVDQGLVLQVGHQERLVCRALGLFDQPMAVKRLELTRCGPPPKGGRAMDVSVVWDLMIHDIDIAHCLLGPDAAVLAATGICSLGDELDEVEAGFRIESTDVALRASRLAEGFDRRMKLICESGSIEVDFVNRTVENTTHYKLNGSFANDMPDPLEAADEHFFAACLRHGETVISGQSVKFAVATAEKLEKLARLETGTH